MDMVVSRQRIASAFLTSQGQRGGISRQAQARGVSRQRIYRESDWVHRQLQTPEWQSERQALRQQVSDLRRQLAEREKRLSQCVLLDRDRQAEFASVGQACGVSLPQLRRLLEVLLGEKTPSVAKLGRWTKEAGDKASEALKVLDEFARPRVKIAATDEIYTKAPVLMGVEPESMCWVVGQKSDTVDGDAWEKVLATMPNLEYVTKDEGAAMKRGMKSHNAAREDKGLTPVASGLDHFHSTWEGGRGLSRLQRNARIALAKAENAQKEFDRRRRKGHSLSGIATQLPRWWEKAEKAFDYWSKHECSWNEAKDALRLVTPEGELNTPERSQRLVSEALAPLPEAEFGKGKRQLRDPETYTYLKEVRRKLDAVAMPQELKDAAVKVECLRRRPDLLAGESTKAALQRGMLLMSMVILAKAEKAGQETLAAVAKTLASAWRASSLVECVNSVVRMQQARHRKLTQGMIDLKRLNWNTTPFRTGRRRKKSPYEHLGVKLPEGVTWWELLKWPPEQLRQQLSTLNGTI